MTTPAAAYAARLAEWERTASEDDKMDGKGEPEGPTLERDGLIAAWVENDGGLYVERRVQDAAEALALRDFISEHYEEPEARLLSCDPRLLLLRDAAEFVNLVAEGRPFGVETAGRAQEVLDHIKAMLSQVAPAPLTHAGVPISFEDDRRISRDGP